MKDEEPSLLRRLRWIVVAGLAVAAVRFALDARRVDDPIWFDLGGVRFQAQIGNYYVMPLLFLIGALAGTFRGLSWGKIVGAAALVSLFCWALPNTVVYTTAQFLGWTHGRFAPGPVAADQRDAYEAYGEEGTQGRAPAIPKSATGKLWAGLSVAALTGVAAFVWNFLWLHVLVVLPRLFSRSASREAASP